MEKIFTGNNANQTSKFDAVLQLRKLGWIEVYQRDKFEKFDSKVFFLERKGRGKGNRIYWFYNPDNNKILYWHHQCISIRSTEKDNIGEYKFMMESHSEIDYILNKFLE